MALSVTFQTEDFKWIISEVLMLKPENVNIKFCSNQKLVKTKSTSNTIITLFCK